MNYFVTQEWNSTKGNHAGMSHLCDLISAANLDEVRHYKVPCFCFKNARPLYHLWYLCFALLLIFKVKRTDVVFLMEYLFPTRKQDWVALLLKAFTGCKIVALAHLVPKELESLYPTDEKLHKWCKKVDILMTFGTSLTSYLESRNVPTKLLTVFHYVDLDYYRMKERKRKSPMSAIFMGTMQRDFEALEAIVAQCPEIDFFYLKGKSKRDTIRLEKYTNLKMCGFLEESELKDLMNQCDVSLNLMYDTIGSNVITTSLAMGMVMLVSDVGSIHNYCDEDNSIFCKTPEDFVKALHYLDDNKDVLDEMSANAFTKAQILSFHNFYNIITA